MQARLTPILKEAHRFRERKDISNFRQRLVSAKRLKGQIDKMDKCLETMHCNMDQLVHCDITKVWHQALGARRYEPWRN